MCCKLSVDAQLTDCIGNGCTVKSDQSAADKTIGVKI